MPISRHRRRRGRSLPRSARSAGTLATARPRRKRINKLYLVASAVIAVLVIAGFAVGGIGGGRGGNIAVRTGSGDEFVPGVGQQQTILAATHLAEGTTINYDSFPPTSGNHWPPRAVAPCGFYEDGLRDERAVHNLEHGNIVVSYNFSDPAQVERLRNVVDNIGLANIWGVTRFYDKIDPGQVAVATWGVLDIMEGIDPERIRTFFETYAGNLGPEQVTCGVA